MSDYHIPVMLKEVLELLQIKKDHWYVDCNLGGGGHTQGILKTGGNVLGIDLDPDAIKEVSHHLKNYIDNGRLKLAQTNFMNIADAVNDSQIPSVSGVLFDLGVSTHQLEETERGFSFNKDAPHDIAAKITEVLENEKLKKQLIEKGEKRVKDFSWKKLAEETFKIYKTI